MTLTKRQRHALGVMAVIVAGLLAGCGGGTTESQPTTHSTPAPTKATPDPIPPGATVGPDGNIYGTVPTPPPMAAPTLAPPTWDKQSEYDAIAEAESVMRLYATPDSPSAYAWHQSVDSHLTPRAKEALANVHPQYIPAHKLTGQAALDPDRSNPYQIWSTVPTDAGDYRILLIRSGAGQKWKADIIEPKNLKG